MHACGFPTWPKNPLCWARVSNEGPRRDVRSRWGRPLCPGLIALFVERVGSPSFGQGGLKPWQASVPLLLTILTPRPHS